MAAPIGRADAPVKDALFAEPYRFGFFQAVRLLERFAPGCMPVGRDGPPGRESVRFHVPATLLFPPSEIAALTSPDGTDGPAGMTVAFLGLIGPLGVLPHTYTELVAERARAGDPTAAAFLDLFHHRVISLFFRAWMKYRPALAYERGDDDPFTDDLYDLAGLGLAPLRNRGAVPDRAILFHSGAFAQRRRPAVMLEAILAEYFNRPFEVVSFVGQWLRLEPGELSRISPDGPHNALGVSFVLGERCWDEQGRFRVRVGPLTYDEFRAFLPETPAFHELCDLTRLFVDSEFTFEIQLVLRAEEVPEIRLEGSAGTGAQLGRTSWLRSRPMAGDAADAVFEGTSDAR